MKAQNIGKKSNFRISSDLFELATLGLQTVNETVTRCPKVALRYFVPLAAKRFLEVIGPFVFFSANLAFQNTPGIIAQRIGIRWFLWPLCGGNEASNLIFLTILGWRILSAMVLSPVGMSKVCGRNVRMPKASMQPPAYFRNNIRHLFWSHDQ